MDKISRGSEARSCSRWSVEPLCLVFVRMEGAPTARDETRERSPSGRTNSWSPVSSSGGTLTVLNEVEDVLRFRSRVRQLKRS